MNQSTASLYLLAQEGRPPLMLTVALQALQRTGVEYNCQRIPEEDSWEWILCRLGEIPLGKWRRVLLFCRDAEAACCLANKIRGVQAIYAPRVHALKRALIAVAPQVIVLDPEGWTYYELREVLRLCQGSVAVEPPPLVRLIQEHERHAHR